MISDAFWKAWKGFTEPLRMCWLIVLGVTFSLFTLAMYAEVRLTELAQASSDELLMLACEAATESGYDYWRAMQDHADMLDAYLQVEGERNRSVSHMLYLLYPEFDPEQRLRSLQAKLRRPLSQEEAEEQIANAAKVLREFAGELQDSTNIVTTGVRFWGVNETQQCAIDVAIKESDEALLEYGKALDLANAERACRKNRRMAVHLFLGRAAYVNRLDKGILSHAVENVGKTIAYNRELWGNLGSERDRALLVRYSHSEERRLEILRALQQDDVRKAREILREAVEQAYMTERKTRGGIQGLGPDSD